MKALVYSDEVFSGGTKHQREGTRYGTKFYVVLAKFIRIKKKDKEKFLTKD